VQIWWGQNDTAAYRKSKSLVAAVCCCAALMIERTQRAPLERRGWGASGAGLLWLNEAAPSLRSNITQTALVATLDTYDFMLESKFFLKQMIHLTGKL
jgi:hypothetical protein